MKPLRILTALLALLAQARAADFVLTDEGVAPVPIVVFKDAPPRTRDAAVTLADYIEKMSGVRPEVLDGEPSPVPERAIWIGVQPVVKTLFPKSDFDFKHPEETLIVANEKYLVIAGRDRWDPAHMEAMGRLVKKTGVQQEYGTVNAVYTFIQDKLGVRWLWPEEEDVLVQRRIAIAPFEQHHHPQIRSRGGMFKVLSFGDNAEGPDELWARFQRVQLDSLALNGGHGFGHWWEKYSAGHPDYFALQPDGTRSPNPRTITNTKLCESNPAVWEQWLEEVEEQLVANPTQQVFNVSENDSYNYGHCVCEKCVAKDHPDGEKFTFLWAGKQEQRPALSDRQVKFANTLARLLKQRYPDRRLFVQLHAYGYTRPAPIGVVPDANVIISSVANFFMRSPDERKLPMQQHAAWSQKAQLLMWRPNLGSPVGLGWGMPDIAMTQAGEDFRYLAKHHGIGVFLDMLWFHWATQGPHYYALAHLAWNPHADVQAVMDDYYQRGFGPAAADVKAYWTLLERTRMEFIADKANRQRTFDIPRKYTPELLARAQSHLDAAATKLTAADEKYRRRLHFIRCGLDYTKLVVATRAAMLKVETSNGKDTDARAQVLAHWATAAKMKPEFPNYAINWSVVFRLDGPTKRIMGLHPDYPVTGRALRELLDPDLE